MTKIAEVIRFYSLDKIMDFIKEGGEYPRHHLWCYDKLKNSGIDVECIEYAKNSWLNETGKSLKIMNFQQQLNLLKRSKEFDLVFAPFIEDILIIAALKILGLFKKPILGIPMNRYIPRNKNFLKRIRQKLLRQIYFNGIDSLLFINENLYQNSNKYNSINEAHGFLNSWGVDNVFFETFLERQITSPSEKFVYSTGGTGRDFKTLINAFKEINFTLKITTKRQGNENTIKNIPPNIIIDNTIIPGLNSVNLIRKEYFNSLAVAIPLSSLANYIPVGLTVLMEAMAMGKTVISTRNKNYPFDLEKEKVGYYVDFEDVNGWRQCINHIIDNPEDAREMGNRARSLARKKYNYDLFSIEIINKILQMTDEKKSV